MLKMLQNPNQTMIIRNQFTVIAVCKFLSSVWQGCVRGRHGRGQGQSQIISDQCHVRLWNPTWLMRLHTSMPYCHSSVLTTQSFAYYYY